MKLRKRAAQDEKYNLKRDVKIKQHRETSYEIVEMKTEPEDRGCNITSYYQNPDSNHSINKFKCKFCKKVFDLKVYLEIHEVEHENICDLCGKCIKGKSNLREHMMTHCNSKSDIQ
jgi:hypothetical protein